MSTHEHSRRAHELVDAIKDGYTPDRADVDFLRSFLPELPKQKTLKEIHEEVDEAWLATNDPELKERLREISTQIRGLFYSSPNSPALPAGMRLADHAVYGRVITSPKPNRNGVYDLLVSRPKFETGADWEYAHECELTFVDAEPAAPASPKFLETEADYRDAPVGTVVAKDNHSPAWKPNEHWFINNNPFDNREMAGGLNPAPSRVLRWGK